MNIAPNYCLGFAHHPSGRMDTESKSLVKFGLHIFHSVIEEGPSTISPQFDKFINILVDKYYNDLEDAENAQLDEYAN